MANRHVYFLKGDRYIRVNIGTDLVDVGPAAIRQFWDLPTAFQSNLDTVVNWGNEKLYLFKGREYVRYDMPSERVDVGPVSIAQNWTHLPAFFHSDIDASVNWGNGKAYFFKVDHYVRYDIRSDLVDVGPALIRQFWKHLPDFFHSDLDAVVNWGNGKVYFFKADHYVRYDIASDLVDVGPALIRQFWTHLPADFQSDIGAGVKCGEELNEILFCAVPSGLSSSRAQKLGVPAGVTGSERLAANDRTRVAKLKSLFDAIGRRHELPPALLAGIASHESACGANLDAKGEGDKGSAFGIMQVDKRFVSQQLGRPDPKSSAHIDQATGILGIKLGAVRKSFPGASTERQLQGAVAAYNGMPASLTPDRIDARTTSKDYSNDVWARARYFAEAWSDL